MEFFAEIIIYVVVEILLSFPVGWFRWLIFKRKTLKEYQSEWGVNLFIIASLTAVTLLTIKLIKEYLNS
jgi:hypothetical protein